MSTREGWYPDPEVEGQSRYWNGAGWEDVVMPTSIAPPVPSTSDRAWAATGEIGKLLMLVGLIIALLLFLYLLLVA